MLRRQLGRARAADGRCARSGFPSRLLRRPPGRLARLVDAAAPALHGMAPVVRRDRGVTLAPVLAAAGALALSAAQRWLSTPARTIRRRTARVDGSLTLATGETVTIDAAALLAPLEHALRAMSWAIVLLAASLAVARFA